jgi:hypothetical protein
MDPVRHFPPGRVAKGSWMRGFWPTYDEYANGWGGMVHWVDFYGIRKR